MLTELIYTRWIGKQLINLKLELEANLKLNYIHAVHSHIHALAASAHINR